MCGQGSLRCASLRLLHWHLRPRAGGERYEDRNLPWYLGDSADFATGVDFVNEVVIVVVMSFFLFLFLVVQLLLLIVVFFVVFDVSTLQVDRRAAPSVASTAMRCGGCRSQRRPVGDERASKTSEPADMDRDDIRPLAMPPSPVGAWRGR